MKNLFIQKLRNKQTLKMFDSKERLFNSFKYNAKGSRVCWERWVSRDRINWTKWNDRLTLRDVCDIRARIILANLESL